jgi:GDP-4-dehydro-6-deoxy-D-mannose reductase
VTVPAPGGAEHPEAGGSVLADGGARQSVLVTGGAGFAGRHLVALLQARGHDVSAPAHGDLDLLDSAAVRAFVRARRPRTIFHLAALASVGRSWEDPAATIDANVRMTLNVLEAVRAEAPDTAVVPAGSGEVYGPPARLPVDEDAPLRPQNPYAVSKAACDLLGGQYADAHGLRVIRTRAFNHAGPGQSDEYVIGTIARQVAAAELTGQAAELRTGNPDSARDFTDVRDVVRAYLAAAELPAGTYNVCSGHSATVRELVELVRAAARVEVRHTVDPARVRAHDVPEVRGSAQRLHAATGWEPAIPLDQTVADALESWREALSQAGPG